MPDPGLYRRVLGEAFERLPPPIREAHEGVRRMSGVAQVERGSGLRAQIACRVMGFPRTGADVPVEVRFSPIPGGELWRRRFGDQAFESRQTSGEGAWSGLICERFGLITVGLKAPVSEEGLELRVVRWSVLGVPLPMWLAPGGPAREYVEDGRFRFDVEMRHPLIGRIVRYRGWLQADETWTAGDAGQSPNEQGRNEA